MPAVTSRDALPSGGRVEGTATRRLGPDSLDANPISLEIYGDPAVEIGGLKESIREHGILVPLVVEPGLEAGRWAILSGHRRWACALPWDCRKSPARSGRACRRRPAECAILEYNRQRRKSFSQLMREADVLEELWMSRARKRRLANLRQGEFAEVEAADCDGCRMSEFRRSRRFRGGRGRSAVGAGLGGRTDAAIAQRIGLGGKDLYRQARSHLADGAARGHEGPKRRGPARRRDQDDPRGL